MQKSKELVKKDVSLSNLNVSSTVKLDQLVHFAEKVWGHEEWIVNNDKYCGKKLVLNQGFRCSMHKHNIKDETFYILSGNVLMESEYNGKSAQRVMTAGDVIHIKVGMWHRFSGIVKSEIMEFSTFHMEEDSIRREVSGSFDLDKLSL